jgi:DNA-binding response OmpR family regulator
MASKILIVDDSTDATGAMQLALESSGYEVRVESDGTSGADRALKESFDLIVADIHMPNVNGIQMLQMIIREKRLRSEPIPRILVLTAMDPTRHFMCDEWINRELGLKGVLLRHKPIGIDDFLLAVADAFLNPAPTNAVPALIIE